jgi:Caspase domain
VRELAVQSKKQGMNLNELVSRFRLYNIIKKSGANEDQIESFISSCMSGIGGADVNSLPPEKIVDITNQLFNISKSEFIALEQVPDYIQQKLQQKLILEHNKSPSHMVNEEIEAFFSERKRDDLLLLYFSCHGIKDEFRNLYFATCNTVRKMILSTSVSANLVNFICEQSPSNERIIILDCCYSGTYIKNRSMFNISKTKKSVILTSSNAVQYSFQTNAFDRVIAHSVFTNTLVKGIWTGNADLDQDGIISCGELYQYLGQYMKHILYSQSPQIMLSGESPHDINIAQTPIIH